MHNTAKIEKKNIVFYKTSKQLMLPKKIFLSNELQE